MLHRMLLVSAAMAMLSLPLLIVSSLIVGQLVLWEVGVSAALHLVTALLRIADRAQTARAKHARRAH